MLGGKGPYNRKSRRCEAYRRYGDAPGKLRDEISLAIGAAVVHIVVGDLVDSDTTPYRPRRLGHAGIAGGKAARRYAVRIVLIRP